MTPTQEPPAATVQDSITKDVLVNVVLDRSGSMQQCQKGTIEGYNEYLNGLKADKESNYSVSLIQFDSPGNQPELTVSYTDKSLSDVPKLSGETYQPRGGTPLFDAVGECIRRVDVKQRGVITVIITDGHENASQEFTAATIKKLIQEKESEGWKFIFLGANIDAATVGGSMGIAATDTANYATVHMDSAFDALRGGTMRYAAASRAHGTRSMQARMSAAPTQAERSAMMGGRPAAPPTFRPSAPTAKAPAAPSANAEAKGRTKWAVRDEVHGS
jgi:hypothetical protein